MYAEKSRRTRPRRAPDPGAAVATILREHEPELTDHHEDVSRLAVAVGRELEFDAEEIDVLRRAAEFHDIGKIAIPEEILSKPAPLDNDGVGADAQAHAGRRAAPRHLPVDGSGRPPRPRRPTSAGTAVATRTASPARRSRWVPGSSPSATPSTRCEAPGPIQARGTGTAPWPRSAAERAASSTPGWWTSSVGWSTRWSASEGQLARPGAAGRGSLSFDRRPRPRSGTNSRLLPFSVGRKAVSLCPRARFMGPAGLLRS